MAEFPEDRWDALLAILLTSPFLLAKYAVAGAGAQRRRPHRRRRLRARARRLAVQGRLRLGQARRLGLVKTLALEGADKAITATALCPGFVRTPLVEKQIGDQARAHGLPEERVLEDVILQPHAVKRLIEPAEVAGVVSFLLGPDGRAFTGAPVTMDLGWTAR